MTITKENFEMIMKVIKLVMGFILLVFMLYIYFFKEKFDYLLFGLPVSLMNLPTKEIFELYLASKGLKGQKKDVE